MRRFVLLIPLAIFLSGCAFFKALTSDPDGSGPKKSPISQAAEELGSATLDYAGLAALIFTVGKTIGRTIVVMRAAKQETE